MAIVVDKTNPAAPTTGADFATVTCTNPTATLTPNGAGYVWSAGNSVTPMTTTTYTVTYTAANGCTAQNTMEIVVNKTAPVAALANDGPLTCTKTSVTLTGSGAMTYVYSGGSATVTTPATYSVTAMAANGCTAIATTNVLQNIIAPVPVAAATIAQLTCTNTSSVLSATGGDTFVWSSGGTTVILPNTYIVTATTTANGCTATASIAVTRNIVPPVIGISGGSVLNCTTTTIPLTATGNGASFAWSNNVPATLGTANTQAATVAAIYTVVATGTNGCLATATKNITQNIANPVINIAGATAFCMGASTNLMASPGFAIYAWSNGASTRQVLINVAGTYTVSVTAVNGCSTSKTIVVTLNTLPTLSIATIAPICVGTAMNLVAVVGGTPAATTVNWIAPNNTPFSTPVVSGSATLTRTMSSAIAGTYIARATNACGTRNLSRIVQASNLIPVTIAIQNASILSGSTGSITVTAASGSTFAWSVAGTAISVPSTQNYIRNRPAGTYTVIVTPPVGSTACSVTRVVVIN
jgi:hypothetical protein